MKRPIKNGVHCWRWFSKRQQSWGLFGISHPKKHRDGSYAEQGVYGIASGGSYYVNGASRNDVPAQSMYAKPEMLVDMKLDCNKNELSYMVVGDPNKKIMKITGIEKNKQKGFVPHISIYYQHTNVQIKKYRHRGLGKIQRDPNSNINVYKL